ncbi:hypothetical protein AXFE_27220 [Acidithrix ferrooxidans]|uniref:Uncharacterized protein n=1 Tax=Acidithrix ferrooxidans TaxID=1280514 RepID=A0A0D8HEQ7_9ACTN|nr:hypothetical protein AXFE_27220 [Acidithrix ferrooxidans]
MLERNIGPIGRIVDPSTNQLSQCRKVQPFQASKIYLCPACSYEIGHGIGHFVVVPDFDPTQRRHWHESCLKRALSQKIATSNRSKGRKRKKTKKQRHDQGHDENHRSNHQ